MSLQSQTKLALANLTPFAGGSQNLSATEAGARVERAIIDKGVTIGHNAQVGYIYEDDKSLGIIVIGKEAKIPNAMKIGRGVKIGPNV